MENYKVKLQQFENIVKHWETVAYTTWQCHNNNNNKKNIHDFSL